jgi:L-ascorbate metabolism protein UlaG (beta-lactamase superfamily)
VIPPPSRFCIAASPVRTDLAAALDPQDDCAAVRFWWLGQAGFAFKHRGRLLLIDPYLSDSLAKKYRNSELEHQRMMPVPVAPESIHGCGWYLCTHAHTDHMDPLTIRAVRQAANPVFVAPRAEVARAVERGIPSDRLCPLNAGETLNLAPDVTIAALASAHERLEMDTEGNHKYLGYVITLGGVRLYHSGDCVPYAGLERQLAERRVDVAFLPLNGRDAYRASRGVAGNFTISEAITLCRAAGIGWLVGHHFGMFDFNTVDRPVATQSLAQMAGTLRWLLPEIGITYTIAPDEAVSVN